jgi:hypothetical protein
VREHRFDGGHVLLRFVAAVVDEHVDLWNLLPEFPPERRVGLVSDVDRGVGRRIGPAGRLDVDAVNVRASAEV